MPVVSPVCQECHSVVPFADPNFCTSCGAKLSDEAKLEATYPKCPEGIEHGHCEECLERGLKECDTCGSTVVVKYKPKWLHKCLCSDCREVEAMAQARSRSW